MNKSKLQLAHEYALVRITCNNHKTLDEIISLSWYYADARQAEAEKRKDKGIPEALCKVDWRVAPQDTTGWQINEGRAYWIDSDLQVRIPWS